MSEHWDPVWTHWHNTFKTRNRFKSSNAMQPERDISAVLTETSTHTHTRTAAVSQPNPRQPVSADTCLWALQAGHLLMARLPANTESSRGHVSLGRLSAAGVRARWGAADPAQAERLMWSGEVSMKRRPCVEAVVALRWSRLSGCALPLQPPRSPKGPSTKTSARAKWK